MTSDNHVNFAIVTPVGAIVETRATKAEAVERAKERLGDEPGQFPALSVVEIVVTTKRRTVWTPRHQLVGSAGR